MLQELLSRAEGSVASSTVKMAEMLTPFRAVYKVRVGY
jgi:hypothetical protein